jgi:ABC-type cobalamin/Fe3+-siderophores transport system ATPase subunit
LEKRSNLVKIEIKSLSFSYSSHKILDDVNLTVHDSEIVSLVGPNGSGKTTLIKCIDSILRPKGSIFLDGRNIERLSRQEIARTIGYVPQSSFGIEALVMDVSGKPYVVPIRSFKGASYTMAATTPKIREPLLV